MRATAAASRSEHSRTTAGTSSSPAISAALQRRSPATISKLPGPGRAHDDRLDDAACPHRMGELFEGGLLHYPARLVLAAADDVHRQPAEAAVRVCGGRSRPGVPRGHGIRDVTEEGVETTAEPALLHHLRMLTGSRPGRAFRRAGAPRPRARGRRGRHSNSCRRAARQAVARRLGKADVARDDGAVDLLPEMLHELLRHLAERLLRESCMVRSNPSSCRSGFISRRIFSIVSRSADSPSSA